MNRAVLKRIWHLALKLSFLSSHCCHVIYFKIRKWVIAPFLGPTGYVSCKRFITSLPVYEISRSCIPWQIHNNLFKKLPTTEPDGSLAFSSCPIQNVGTHRRPDQTLEISGNSRLAKTLAKQYKLSYKVCGNWQSFRALINITRNLLIFIFIFPFTFKYEYLQWTFSKCFFY
jgi:hypothetical protein